MNMLWTEKVFGIWKPKSFFRTGKLYFIIPNSVFFKLLCYHFFSICTSCFKIIGYIQEMESLGQMASLHSPCSGTAKLFLKVLYNFTFLPAVEGSSFPISLSALVIICHFYCSHPSGCEMKSHCCINLCFLDD